WYAAHPSACPSRKALTRVQHETLGVVVRMDVLVGRRFDCAIAQHGKIGSDPRHRAGRRAWLTFRGRGIGAGVRSRDGYRFGLQRVLWLGFWFRIFIPEPAPLLVVIERAALRPSVLSVRAPAEKCACDESECRNLPEHRTIHSYDERLSPLRRNHFGEYIPISCIKKPLFAEGLKLCHFQSGKPPPESVGAVQQQHVIPGAAFSVVRNLDPWEEDVNSDPLFHQTLTQLARSLLACSRTVLIGPHKYTLCAGAGVEVLKHVCVDSWPHRKTCCSFDCQSCVQPFTDVHIL